MIGFLGDESMIEKISAHQVVGCDYKCITKSVTHCGQGTAFEVGMRVRANVLGKFLVPEDTEGTIVDIRAPCGYRTNDALQVKWDEQKRGITDMKPKELDIFS